MGLRCRTIRCIALWIPVYSALVTLGCGLVWSLLDQVDSRVGRIYLPICRPFVLAVSTWRDICINNFLCLFSCWCLELCPYRTGGISRLAGMYIPRWVWESLLTICLVWCLLACKIMFGHWFGCLGWRVARLGICLMQCGRLWLCVSHFVVQ